MVRDYGMIRGRFYTSLTGGAPPDCYTSSISGFAFWAINYGFITWSLSETGYAAPLAQASKGNN
jgi:hypothetical protein